jgi:hypothetical protein
MKTRFTDILTFRDNNGFDRFRHFRNIEKVLSDVDNFSKDDHTYIISGPRRSGKTILSLAYLAYYFVYKQKPRTIINYISPNVSMSYMYFRIFESMIEGLINRPKSSDIYLRDIKISMKSKKSLTDHDNRSVSFESSQSFGNGYYVNNTLYILSEISSGLDEIYKNLQKFSPKINIICKYFTHS